MATKKTARQPPGARARTMGLAEAFSGALAHFRDDGDVKVRFRGGDLSVLNDRTEIFLEESCFEGAQITQYAYAVARNFLQNPGTQEYADRFAMRMKGHNSKKAAQYLQLLEEDYAAAGRRMPTQAEANAYNLMIHRAAESSISVIEENTSGFLPLLGPPTELCEGAAARRIQSIKEWRKKRLGGGLMPRDELYEEEEVMESLQYYYRQNCHNRMKNRTREFFEHTRGWECPECAVPPEVAQGLFDFFLVAKQHTITSTLCQNLVKQPDVNMCLRPQIEQVQRAYTAPLEDL